MTYTDEDKERIRANREALGIAPDVHLLEAAGKAVCSYASARYILEEDTYTHDVNLVTCFRCQLLVIKEKLAPMFDIPWITGKAVRKLADEVEEEVKGPKNQN